MVVRPHTPRSRQTPQKVQHVVSHKWSELCGTTFERQDRGTMLSRSLESLRENHRLLNDCTYCRAMWPTFCCQRRAFRMSKMQRREDTVVIIMFANHLSPRFHNISVAMHISFPGLSTEGNPQNLAQSLPSSMDSLHARDIATNQYLQHTTLNAITTHLAIHSPLLRMLC